MCGGYEELQWMGGPAALSMWGESSVYRTRYGLFKREGRPGMGLFAEPRPNTQEARGSTPTVT